MTQQGKIARIKVVACREVYAGVNQKGDRYRIYEVNATREDGTPIREKLRSFGPMQVGSTVEVRVVPFKSERHGTSFTLYPVDGSRHGAQQSEIDQLRQAVATLTQRVERLEQMAPQVAPQAPSGATW
jgi:hypothetical protein